MRVLVDRGSFTSRCDSSGPGWAADGLSPLFARIWVRTDAVLPLLDGLDEVAAVLREDCVAAINAWRDDHVLLPIDLMWRLCRACR